MIPDEPVLQLAGIAILFNAVFAGSIFIWARAARRRNRR